MDGARGERDLTISEAFGCGHLFGLCCRLEGYGEESLAVTLVRWKHRILSAIAGACFLRKRSH